MHKSTILLYLLCYFCVNVTSIYLFRPYTLYEISHETAFFGHFNDFWNCYAGLTRMRRGEIMPLQKAIDIYRKSRTDSIDGTPHADKDNPAYSLPFSVLDNEAHLRVLRFLLDNYKDNRWKPEDLYMRMTCDLYLDSEWWENTYRRGLNLDIDALDALTDILYRFHFCLVGYEMVINCPEPCDWKQPFCNLLKHSNKICTIFIRDELRPFRFNMEDVQHLPSKQLFNLFKTYYKQIHSAVKITHKLFEILESSYELVILQRAIYLQDTLAQNPICECREYHQYNSTTDTCEFQAEDVLCYDVNPCENGGRCRINVEGEYNCECRPAFQGEFCEYERNPCLFSESSLCGEFECKRDPYNWKYGFKCVCPHPFYHSSTSNDYPACIDVNECSDSSNAYCKNGAECHNLFGGFYCTCQKGFSGTHCEIISKPSEWNSWGEWSSCMSIQSGGSCSNEPYRLQTRDCLTNSIGQFCIGPYWKIEICHDLKSYKELSEKCEINLDANRDMEKNWLDKNLSMYILNHTHFFNFDVNTLLDQKILLRNVVLFIFLYTQIILLLKWYRFISS